MVWASKKRGNSFHPPGIEPYLCGRKVLYKKLDKKYLTILILLLIASLSLTPLQWVLISNTGSDPLA